MPIANCIITAKCQKRPGASGIRVELWANESKVSSEHITINIITSREQPGNHCAIMVSLLLPSIWSNQNISLFQLSLAKALTLYFNVSLQEVFISTSLPGSGRVVYMAVD